MSKLMRSIHTVLRYIMTSNVLNNKNLIYDLLTDETKYITLNATR